MVKTVHTVKEYESEPEAVIRLTIKIMLMHTDLFAVPATVQLMLLCFIPTPTL